MAIKTQEKKTSRREEQLERKVASLEEELNKTKIQLDREYLAQEAKKAKVHNKNNVAILYIIPYLLYYTVLYILTILYYTILYFIDRQRKNFYCGRNRRNGSRQQKS